MGRSSALFVSGRPPRRGRARSAAG